MSRRDDVKIAIHHRPGSFSDQWIEYCRERGVAFKRVDCYRSDIVEQLRDCDGLMWHWAHHDHKAVLFARQLTYSLEAAGKHVFPNSRTCWHFDDKVGQKYLFEAIGAPLVPTYVSYDKQEALAWAEETDFPKVFKLRRGASSMNVCLVRTKGQAVRLIHTAFGRGLSPANRLALLRDKRTTFSRHHTLDNLTQLTKAAIRCMLPGRIEKNMPREKGYVYFQDFVPNAAFDTRAVVIGDRCFAIRRQVRDGDFRASGSGLIHYERELFAERYIRMAFSIAQRVVSRCMAIDCVIDQNNELRILEISYAFDPKGYRPCPGYWDSELKWYEGTFSPQCFMVEQFVREVEGRTDGMYR